MADGADWTGVMVGDLDNQVAAAFSSVALRSALQVRHFTVELYRKHWRKLLLLGFCLGNNCSSFHNELRRSNKRPTVAVGSVANGLSFYFVDVIG